MANLEIRKYPDSVLSQRARKVGIKEIKTPEFQELVLDMLETMENNNGVGLAAPQIGKSICLCVLKIDNKSYILFNPKIKSRSWKKEVQEEGCLSLPGKYFNVRRSKKIKVEALNRKAEKICFQAESLLARAIQHELDHLNGVLIIKKGRAIKEINEHKKQKNDDETN